MKNRIAILTGILMLMGTAVFASCTDPYTPPPWEWGNGNTDEEKKDDEDKDDEDKDDEDDPVVNAEKPRYIWVDAAANFPDFANSKEKIARDLALAKDAGFTDIVVDVRPTTGDVLFQTDVVQQVAWLGAWVSGSYTKITRTADWDYLQAFVDECRNLELRVHAAINTFTGGNTTSLGSQGVLFREPAKNEWATMLNTADGIVNILSTSQNAKFFNPVREDVQNYLCDLLADLAAYDLDGIILDRGRFDGFQSDFSGYTRTKFEEYLGTAVANFPNDILVPGTKTMPAPMPAHLKKWIEFRAKVIHDFIVKAGDRVRGVNPDIKFGVYVGGWYSSYYDVGVNWGSPRYNAAARLSWATTNYNTYGYADHVDHMLIGAYAAADKIYGTSEWTMQGFCSKAMEYTADDCPIVAGGPDVGNWSVPSGTDPNESIKLSVKACMDACDGYFLFDMIHLKQANQWQYVKAGIEEAVKE